MNNVLVLQQRILAKWRGQIDGTDAIIVSHIERIQSSHNPKLAAHRIDGGYCWVDLGTLLWDNPTINVDYRGLKKRLSKLVTLGLIERQTFFERGRHRSYFRLSNEWHKWVAFWEQHDGEEAARVYGWPPKKQENHSSPVVDTGEPQYPSEGNHSTPVLGNHSSHDPKVLTKGTSIGSAEARMEHKSDDADTSTDTNSSDGEEKNKRPSRRKTADATHPTLDVPMNQKRYDNLVAEYGQGTVDRAIQSRLDWEASKGKSPAKDYAAAAANWIANEAKWAEAAGRDDAILKAI